jgi:hypothetical protein
MSNTISKMIVAAAVTATVSSSLLPRADNH